MSATTAALFATPAFVQAMADALDYDPKSLLNTTPGRREQLVQEFRTKAPTQAASRREFCARGGTCRHRVG